MSNTKKLYRSKTDRIIFGICGGLGEYFEIDPLVFRILFILLTFTGGSGVIIYILLAIIIPGSDGQKLKSVEVKNVIDEAQEKTQDIAAEIKKNGSWIKNVKNIVGLVIVLIGLNIFFEQVFKVNAFSFINWGIIWAVVIVLIGVKIIFNNKK
jgi:phage shock protein PspC (stress-responsive transcriptional regulator)